MPDHATRLYIGERIKTLRKAQQLTLQGLADKLALTPQVIWLYEKGRIDLPSTRLLQVAQALNVQPGELYPALSLVPEEVPTHV